VTVYLLDENVLRELHSKGNREVRAWYASVAQSDLRISAMTFFEKRRGWERGRKSDVITTAVAPHDPSERENSASFIRGGHARGCQS
jgi:predicted nucleic acid-binding protein